MRWALVAAALSLLAGCSTSADEAAVCANVWCPIGVCHANGDQPECRCTTWDQAAGAPCDRLQTVAIDAGGIRYDLGLDVTLDPPAQQSSVSKSTQATLPDRFTFTTRSDHDYRFVVTSSSPGVTWKVLLTGGNDVQLQTADATDAAEARVELHASSVSAYTVTVARGPGDEQKAASYSWAYTETNPHDQGDTADTAQVIDAGTTVGTIDFGGDVDAFRFEGEAGVSYWFQLTGTYTTTLELTDLFGDSLETAAYFYVDHQQSFGFIHSEPQAWSGILRVKQSNPPARLDWLPYSLVIQPLPADVVGDTPETATAIPVQTNWTGRLDLPGDTDVYSFPVVAERNYVLQIGAGPPELSGLLTSDGSLTNAYTAAQTGVGFVSFHGSASPLSRDVYGGFEFAILELPADEAGGTPDASTPIPVDSTTTGYCVPNGDVDVYSVDAAPNQFLILTGNCGGWCTWSNNSPAFHINVDWNGLDGYIVKPPPTGPLTVTLASGAPYQLQVLDGGFDDFPDTPALAGSITVGTPVSGSIQWGYDRDCFKVDLVGGTRYEATTGGPGVSIGGVPGFSPDLVFTAPDSGTYPVSVQFSRSPNPPPLAPEAPYTLLIAPAP